MAEVREDEIGQLLEHMEWADASIWQAVLGLEISRDAGPPALPDLLPADIC